MKLPAPGNGKIVIGTPGSKLKDIKLSSRDSSGSLYKFT